MKGFKKEFPALFAGFLVILFFGSTELYAGEGTTTTKEGYLDYVDTRIGTLQWEKEITVSDAESPSGFVYPGVGYPFAMTQWTPQTCIQKKIHISVPVPYWWEDDKIQGFRASHYPNGAVVAEYGAMVVMPMIGQVQDSIDKNGSFFRHESEIAKPHYYSVNLDDYNIHAELTAASQTAFFRFTYPSSEESKVLFRGLFSSCKYEFVPEYNEVTGIIPSSNQWGRGPHGNFPAFFVARFEQPYTRASINNSSEDQAVIQFTTDENEQILLKVATSFISIAHARKNLDYEFPDWDFDKAVSKGAEKWESTLSKIQIDGNKRDKEIFYTALQRCHLLPRSLKESEDLYHSPFDGKTHKGDMFTDYSLWDTFRSLHPLLILLQEEKTSEMIRGLLNIYDQGGWLPKWPNPGYANIMMGTHADSVIADAYIKGIRGFDTEKALEAMLKNANTPGNKGFSGRVGIKAYNRLGFVPITYPESVARTLEFAYDDYCISQYAKALNREDLHKEYLNRSLRYNNVLDPNTGLVRGRLSSGIWAYSKSRKISVWAGGWEKKQPGQSFKDWKTSVEKLRKIYYWNHTLLVPHDVQGLANFMGGEQNLINFLDTFFENNFYYVGDEFSMHAPYMYNYIGAPWKTQKIVREILDYYFSNTPGGLPGNDDCGQLSSWYIFGSIGLYPACPGNPVYMISSPVIDKATIDLENGKNFTIIANNNSAKNIYIQSATLNGKSYNKAWIHHDDIISGSTLILEMGPNPNKEWGAAQDTRPKSISKPTTLNS
ncbi:MAG: GH92 family glycosyl hydrolase [Spirochaetales bacterium]|nr:GH92 family glycosyl hydrolase [Spirochaetales bacterium]